MKSFELKVEGISYAVPPISEVYGVYDIESDGLSEGRVLRVVVSDEVGVIFSDESGPAVDFFCNGLRFFNKKLICSSRVSPFGVFFSDGYNSSPCLVSSRPRIFAEPVYSLELIIFVHFASVCSNVT